MIKKRGVFLKFLNTSQMFIHAISSSYNKKRDAHEPHWSPEEHAVSVSLPNFLIKKFSSKISLNLKKSTHIFQALIIHKKSI